MPQVSVILPVYNGAKTVAESITSILVQRDVDLEVIVVDDASTDQSREIVHSFEDPRIVRVDLQSNQGLAAALNHGIAVSQAPLIARQDQDDISHPTRLNRQLQAFKQDSELVLLGTWATIAKPGPNGEWVRTSEHRHPRHDDELRVRLLWNNPFVHSSVMFRRKAFDAVGGYRLDPQHSFPEDYDLWSRLAGVGRLGNLPEPLVTYRTSPEGMSQSTFDDIQRGVIRIGSRNLAAAVQGRYQSDCVKGVVAALNNAVIPRQSGESRLKRVACIWSASARGTRGGRMLLGMRLKAAMKVALRSINSAGLVTFPD